MYHYDHNYNQLTHYLLLYYYKNSVLYIIKLLGQKQGCYPNYPLLIVDVIKYL